MIVKSNKLWIAGAGALLAFVLSGCATLYRGSHQVVPVESVPSGAAVYVNDEHAGETPVSVPLSRRMAHRVRIEKEGFDPAQVFIYTVPSESERRTSLRFSTDDYTGALNDLEPSRVHTRLRPELLPAAPGEDPGEERERLLAAAADLRDRGVFSHEDYDYVVGRIQLFYRSR